MDHNVGCIEYIIPVGNVLDVDEIDYATIDQSIQNVAGATANDKAKAHILIALDGFTQGKIDGNCD